MNLPSLITDILKYSVAGLGILYAAFYIFKPYLDKTQNLQVLEFKKGLTAQTLPLRLQAYERLVLFIERVNPTNLLLRINSNGLSADELYTLIVNEVRSEFQHNVTQQLYVTSRAWSVTRRVKDDTLNVIANGLKTLPTNATGLELGQTVLNLLSKLDENPYDMAVGLLRQDLEDLF